MLNSENYYESVCVDCAKDFYPDIQFCHSDHIVCPNCRKLLKNCPECGLSRSVHIPSNFSTPYLFTYGDTLALISVKEHEYDCEFSPYKCPVPYMDCPFHGSTDEIERHLHEDHGVPIQLSNTIELLIEEDLLAKNCYLEMIYHLESLSFYVILEKCRTLFGTLVYDISFRLIGPRVVAETLSASIEISFDSVSKATISTTQSIRDPHRRVPGGSLIFKAHEIEDNNNNSNGLDVVRFFRFKTFVYEELTY